ncbi:MAG: cysteine peptidase family C39 domain-containing protein, partial [Candidatus Omnitrophica bacterium]|nr:cysteine peptidase family C39 domain-containing protein [Candidatus Omnitrophota bacterium]
MRKPRENMIAKETEPKFHSSFKLWIRVVAFIVVCVFFPQEFAQAIEYDWRVLWQKPGLTTPFTPLYLTDLRQQQQVDLPLTIKNILKDVAGKPINEIQLSPSLTVKLEKPLNISQGRIEEIYRWLIGKPCGTQALFDYLNYKGVTATDQDVAVTALTIDILNNVVKPEGDPKVIKNSLFALSKAAEFFGEKLTPVKLKSIETTPLITHLNNDHYVLVTKVNNGKIYFIDNHQEKILSADKFSEKFSGYALINNSAEKTSGLELITDTQAKQVLGAQDDSGEGGEDTGYYGEVGFDGYGGFTDENGDYYDTNTGEYLGNWYDSGEGESDYAGDYGLEDYSNQVFNAGDEEIGPEAGAFYDNPADLADLFDESEDVSYLENNPAFQAYDDYYNNGIGEDPYANDMPALDTSADAAVLADLENNSTLQAYDQYYNHGEGEDPYANDMPTPELPESYADGDDAKEPEWPVTLDEALYSNQDFTGDELFALALNDALNSIANDPEDTGALTAEEEAANDEYEQSLRNEEFAQFEEDFYNDLLAEDSSTSASQALSDLENNPALQAYDDYYNHGIGEDPFADDMPDAAEIAAVEPPSASEVALDLPEILGITDSYATDYYLGPDGQMGPGYITNSDEAQMILDDLLAAAGVNQNAEVPVEPAAQSQSWKDFFRDLSGSLMSSGDTRLGVAGAALALFNEFSYSDEQAAARQATGEEIAWINRPWFSSDLGLSDLNQGANYGYTFTGYLTNDIFHQGADKERVQQLNRGLIGLTPVERRQYLEQHKDEYAAAGAGKI